MVTPPYKGGFPAAVEGVTETGSQVELRSLGVISHPDDTGLFGSVYEVTRGSTGWGLTPLDAPLSTFDSFEVERISPDFTSSIWFARAPSQPSAIPDVYLGVPPRGPFVRLGPSGPANVGEEVLGITGASRDLSHSFYRVNAAGPGGRNRLWPGDKTSGSGQPSLYEYSVAENCESRQNCEPRLVGVGNAGTASIATSTLISECGTYLGGPGPFSGGRGEYAYNAVSDSGSSVLFTAVGRDYPGCAGLDPSTVEPPVNELYARVDGSQADAHTVAISEPSPVDCGECHLSDKADAEFQGASFEGSEVFFTTVQHLLSGATGTGAALYEYDFHGPAESRVVLLSKGDARVQSVPSVSNDGSHVYFLARGVLTTTANAFGKQAEDGAENLYVYERDATYPAGHLAFIGVGTVNNAQTTPDGRFLVFESPADMTPDEEGRSEAGQVFEYDAETGVLVRTSRGQEGYNEDGNTSAYAATIPTQSFRSDLPTNKFTKLAVSADGAYVFFTSEDGLTPQASSGVANVYEYHAGRVSLISDGHDLATIFEQPVVALLGTDESGNDVFFETADQLVEQDTDTQLDLYDARIDGGFSAAPSSPRCSGDLCQGTLSGGLQPSAPPTSSSGGESLAPAMSAELNAGKASAKPKPRKAKKKSKKRGRKPLRKAKKAVRRGSR